MFITDNKLKISTRRTIESNEYVGLLKCKGICL